MAGETPVPPRTRGVAKAAISTSRDGIPARKFPTLWTKVIGDAMKLYDQTCAYCCFRIHRITGATSIDHMAPKSRAWDQVYEWTNYRLAASRLNARKNAFLDVIDPCEAIDGWFELELVDFQVVPSGHLLQHELDAVEATIARLRLNDQDMRATRTEHAEYFWNREISFAHLQRESPFVARELVRQGRDVQR